MYGDEGEGQGIPVHVVCRIEVRMCMETKGRGKCSAYVYVCSQDFDQGGAEV